jgi:tetratricopeptide (TPR) repeat protein
MSSRTVIVLALALLAGIFGCKHPFVNSGNIYLDQGMLPKAEACYRVALSEEPNNGEAHFQLAFTLSEMAKGHLANGEMDSARVKFIEATKHYMEAAKIDSALWADEAELNMSSNFARVFNEGSKLLRNDDPAAALEYYKLAYQVDPEGENGARAQLNIVQLTYQQITDAYRLAQNSDNKEDEAKAKDQAADLLTQVDKAMPQVKDADTKRTFVEVKAAILRMLDRDEEARKIYEDLLEENPDDITLMLTLARSQKEQGDDKGAAEFFQRALNQIALAPVINEDGRYDYVYAETARAYFRSDQYEKAIDAFKLALDVAKTDAERIDFYDRISVSYFQLENYEKAIEYAKQVTDLDPDHLNAWQIQCRALGRLDRQAEAETACARFYELRDAQDQ